MEGIMATKIPHQFELDGLQFTLVAEAGKSYLPINYAALVPQWSGSSPVQIPGYKPFYLGIVEQVLPVGQIQGGAQRFAFIGFYDTPPIAFSETQLRQMHAYLVTPVNKEDNKAQRLAAIMLGIDLNAGNATEPTPYPWPVADEMGNTETAMEGK
jgi:hypothetical protein